MASAIHHYKILGVVFTLLSCHVAVGQGLGVAGNLVRTADGAAFLQVQSVAAGSLAHRVGVIAGDEIYSINQFPPGDAASNQRAIAAGRGSLSIVVNRRGQRLTLGNGLPGNPVIHPSNPLGDPRHGSQYPIDPRLGHRPGLVPGPELQIDLQVSSSLNGNRLKIISVTRGGLGAQRGLRVGDVIESINGVRVATVEGAARAYYYNNGRIVLRLIRDGQRREIRFTQQHTPGPGPGQPSRPPLKKLALKAVQGYSGLTVISGDPNGLGNQLGLTRGTIIRKINGNVTRTQGDLNKVDEAIGAGKITSLVIEIERSNQRSTVRYPR